jgi:molecular chaperone IbpA
MLTYDFTPMLRTVIGFDHLARQFEAAAQYDDDAYPPYNIESAGEDRYRITFAVAGFAESELGIEVRENTLFVSGQKAEQGDDNASYLFKGIATRNFVRKFELADHVRVTGANLHDGLLTIDLLREVPEEKKPRQIAIKVEAPVGLLDKAKKLISPSKKAA